MAPLALWPSLRILSIFNFLFDELLCSFSFEMIFYSSRPNALKLANEFVKFLNYLRRSGQKYFLQKVLSRETHVRLQTKRYEMKANELDRIKTYNETIMTPIWNLLNSKRSIKTFKGPRENLPKRHKERKSWQRNPKVPERVRKLWGLVRKKVIRILWEIGISIVIPRSVAYFRISPLQYTESITARVSLRLQAVDCWSLSSSLEPPGTMHGKS